MRDNEAYFNDRKLILAEWVKLKDNGVAGDLPGLLLKGSQEVWAYAQAVAADNSGDLPRVQTLRESVTDADSLCARWMTHMERERELGSLRGLEYIEERWAEDHPDLKSSWGWFWRLNYAMDMRRLNSLRAKAEDAQKFIEQALTLAVANEWPGYVCSSAYSLFWGALIRKDYLNMNRYLELFRDNAERMKSNFYLAHLWELCAYLEHTKGHFRLGLAMARKSQKYMGHQKHSIAAEKFNRSELNFLAALGRKKEFLTAFAKLQQNHLVARRGLNEPDTQHLAIEYLDICLAEFNLDEAERCLKSTSLHEHLCCKTRVLRQSLMLELLNPAFDQRFFSPKDVGALENGNSYDYDRVFVSLLLSQYDFRNLRWQDENSSSNARLKLKLENSPHKYLSFLSRLFEMQRSIARGQHADAQRLCRGLVDAANEHGFEGELPLLSTVSRELNKKLGLQALADSKIMSQRAVEDTYGRNYVSAVLTAWPYHLLQTTDFKFTLQWVRKDSTLIFNGAIKLRFRFGSPQAKLAQLLVAKGGRVLTYATLARELWAEDYEPTYHDQKIQALISNFKKLLGEHAVDPRIVSNVPNQGYFISGEKHTQTRTEKRDRKERALLELVTPGQFTTAPELAGRLQLSLRSVQRELKRLVDNGDLEAMGEKKNRRYRRIPRRAA